jgi:hypothetical protein
MFMARHIGSYHFQLSLPAIVSGFPEIFSYLALQPVIVRFSYFCLERGVL